MPRFYDPARGLLVTTSYKVMYTSLSRHHHLRQLREPHALLLWLTRRPTHIMFARNPYDRLVSFWCDKFQTHPRKLGTPGFEGWERVQRICLKKLGVGRASSDETIQRILLGTSFEDFLRILPAVYWQDEHLQPQYWAMAIRYRGLVPLFPLKVDRIIRMEEMDTRELRESYGLELDRLRCRVTDHGPAEQYYTPASRRIVQRLYQGDFARFGYPW